jgi:hypothetical protein
MVMWRRRKRRARRDHAAGAVMPHVEPPPLSLESAVAGERNPLKRFFKILAP